MKDMLWVLGSTGWMPRAGQETCCVLVELDDELIMLDAGTGVANLSLVPDVLERHDRLSVILSHYHLDHMVGLMYLKRFAAHKRIDIYGPGQPIYPRTTQEYVSDLLQEALYSSGHLGFAREVHYHDYGGHGFAVGSVGVMVRPQRHSAPSFQIRLEDALIYATDTQFDVGDWMESAPAHVLLHECWQLAEDDPRHTSVEVLDCKLPRDSFGRVLLIHQNPAWTEADRAYVARRAASHNMELAHDGMRVELP